MSYCVCTKKTLIITLKWLGESSFGIKLLCLWVLCQGSRVHHGSPAPFLWLSETSLRREQMSLVIWPGSLGCCSPTLTLNPQIFSFFSFLQPTANLFVVTKHRLSRGWFHWEALPDMRGALMWLTHTRYCRLIQGLRGLMSLCFSPLLAWSAGIGKYAGVWAEAGAVKKWNLEQIVIDSRIHCCFMQI